MESVRLGLIGMGLIGTPHARTLGRVEARAVHERQPAARFGMGGAWRLSRAGTCPKPRHVGSERWVIACRLRPRATEHSAVHGGAERFVEAALEALAGV